MALSRINKIAKGLQGPKLLVSLLVPLVAFSLVPLFSFSAVSASPDEEYVYYAYLPPTVANLSYPVLVGIIHGNRYNYTQYNYTSFPSNLDLVGVEDGTSYQLYDLSTKALLRSGSLNKYQHVRVSFGSRKTDTKLFEVEGNHIKLVANKPVSALVWGGFIWGIPGFDRPYPENKTISGFASFIPSVDGGLIGREFVFLAFPTYWQPKMYVEEVNKFAIFATEDSKVSIHDSGGNLLQQLDVAKLSMARTDVLASWNVYRVVSSGNVLIYGAAANSMTYLPSLTGGYVGKEFIVARPGGLFQGDHQSYIPIALESAKVAFYDIRKPAGSAAEKELSLGKNDMAFDTSLVPNLAFLVKSSGNITLLTGSNTISWASEWTNKMGYVVPQYIAEDVALLGARAGQEIAFYAPYQAVIFACGDTDVEVNGIPRHMRKDEFITVASGQYTVRPSSAPVIVETLGNMNVVQVEISAGGIEMTAYLSVGFNDWGAYLISPETLYKTYAATEQGGGMGILLYAGIGGVAAVATILVIVMVTRRKKKA